MNCWCNAWEEIHGFQSPDEFARFQRWIADQSAADHLKEVAVAHRYGGSDLFDEHWFKCTSCGQVWRVVAPDPPFSGVFERVNE